MSNLIKKKTILNKTVWKLNFALSIILIPLLSFSQNEPGGDWLKFSGDYSRPISGETYMTRYAVTYEILFDNSWSGLECGASARFVRGGEYYLNYITVPIYWRVQTKYVNISLGIDLSFIINNGEGDKEYDRYDEDGEDAGINRLVLFETIINSGLVLKVGFPIRITKKFTIEPELNVSAYLYGVYFGVGLCFKIPMR